MLVTNVTQPLEIAFRRREHAARAGERLDNHSSNIRCIMQSNQFQQIIGELRPRFRLARREVIVFEPGMSQVIAGDPFTETGPVATNAPDGDAAKVHAMVALSTTNEPRFTGLSSSTPIPSGDLERGICGLRSRATKEHPI